MNINTVMLVRASRRTAHYVRKDTLSKNKLEELYARYNRRELISPDPLEILYRYHDPHDQEIAGLLSALLAYGGVRQIVNSAEAVLCRMNPSPRAFIEAATANHLHNVFLRFKHRWTMGRDIAALLVGVKLVFERFGSLESSFLPGFRPDHETVLPALAAWVQTLRNGTGGLQKGILSCPRQGSACKRLNLFLRWMVRKDAVDPGLWRGVPASKLVIPLDIHMHRIGLEWGLTARKSADLKTALEITAAFRSISPDDPVRYDFALTRASMREEL